MDIYFLSEKTASAEQEKSLERAAVQGGTWLGNEQSIKDWRLIGCGSEAQVYEDADLSKIRKVVNYKVYNRTPKDFIDRVTLYNYLFPETSYDILGFIRFYDDFCFVLRQSFIEGVRLEMAEIENEMLERGFRKDHLCYKKETLVIEDLHQGNLLKDNAGNIFVIDAIPYLNPSSEDLKIDVKTNCYHRSRSREAQKAAYSMSKHPLLFHEKKKQTDCLLSTLYL